MVNTDLRVSPYSNHDQVDPNIYMFVQEKKTRCVVE